MELHISSKNIEITPAIKQYTEDKFKTLASHFKPVDRIHIAFNIVNRTQTAEATTHVYNTDIHASATHDDLYTAINELVHKLDKQLTTHKQKVIDSHR